MKRFLIFIVGAFSLGCSKTPSNSDIECVTPGTYVLCYHPIQTFEAYADPGNLLWLYENPAPAASSIWYTTQSEEFKALSTKHNDHTFPHDIRIGAGGRQNEFFAQDFTSVEVTSDQDFDEDHPAGSSLKDIVRIYSISPYNYVKSGYTETFEWEKYPQKDLFQSIWRQALHNSFEMTHVTYGCNKVFPINYLLSELPTNVLILLGRGEILTEYTREPGASPPFAVLKFERKPTLMRKHTLSITFVEDNGNRKTTKPIDLTW